MPKGCYDGWMCGRYTLTTDDYVSVADALEARYDAAEAAAWRPRFNVAPTDAVPILRAGPEQARVLGRGMWGLVAPRDRDPRPAIQINARAETLGERAMFRHAFARLRVGVVADGFYEWTGTRKARRPIRFHRPDDAPFVFAAIAAPWTDPTNGVVHTRFAIVTTTPNAVVAPVHDRMPVILEPEDVDAWIRDSPPDVEPGAWLDGLRQVLRPFPDAMLVGTPASPRANDVRNDDAACLVAPPTLFG